jgi:hypothetical protein
MSANSLDPRTSSPLLPSIILFRFTIIRERFIVIIWKKRADGIRIIWEGFKPRAA